MKDCDSQVLKVGDRVAYQSVFCKKLSIGRVIGFTAKTVRVRMKESDKHWRNIEPKRLAKVMVQYKA